MNSNGVSKRGTNIKNDEAKNKKEKNYHKASVNQRHGINWFLSEVLSPLFLMLIVPVSTLFLWFMCVKCHGSIYELINWANQKPTFYSIIDEIIISRLVLSKFALLVVVLFFAWAIAMTLILPGKNYPGSLTINGNTPIYKDNGLLYHFVTTIVFYSLAFYLETIGHSVAVFYDRFDEIIVALNFIGGIFCWFLYFKGIYFPSSTDNSTSGNIILDYYWGTELHPRIFGIDVKLITNCRFGMSAWFLIINLFCWKCMKANGFTESILVTNLLISLYLTKFFYWESGYMRTMDIALDRAGFYICYGCICFVPAFYTLPALYLASNPIKLDTYQAVLFFLIGLVCLYLNYDADCQKQVFRSTSGNCLIFGKKPKYIEAKYECVDGSKATSLLLLSGYWGIVRHFHYIPEIMLAFFWTAPALFNSILPYFYVIFLIILLFHRSIRDDEKCSKKYGDYWKDYCKQVPYRIIPFIF